MMVALHASAASKASIMRGAWYSGNVSRAGSVVLNRPGKDTSRDPDDELMARAGEGDRAAWKALYTRNRDRVFRIASRFLQEEASARDVTQEVFISL